MVRAAYERTGARTDTNRLAVQCHGLSGPVDRLGLLALDALLGQLSKEPGSWSQKWATEVVSPVLSKVMALELSPWLFAVMQQDQFVDLDK